MFGAIPCTASESSPKRRGPSSSASTRSRLHRSPTRSRAAANGEGAEAMGGSYGIGLDIRLTSSNLRIASHTLACQLKGTNLMEEPMGPIEDLGKAINGIAEGAGHSTVEIGRAHV